MLQKAPMELLNTLWQWISGEQHWPGGHITDISVHIVDSGHPPLLIEHENLQYSVPVSLHAWQSDPLGHTKPVQAAMKIQE